MPLLHSGFAKISRSSRRREGKADDKFVPPASPRREAAQQEQSLEDHPLQRSPLREGMPKQARAAPVLGSSAGTHLSPPRLQHSIDPGTPTKKAKTSSSPRDPIETGPVSQTSKKLHSRGSAKVPVAGLGGRCVQQGESLIGMLSHPRTRARLVLLLETLDALDRAQSGRRFARPTGFRTSLGNQRSVRKAVTTATPVHYGHASMQSPSSEVSRRAPRTHRQAFVHQQELERATGRGQATPLRDRNRLHGLDDLAGMSSDWTERSENGELSEHASYPSDDERSDLLASGPDLFSVDPSVRAMTNGGAKSFEPQPAPSIATQMRHAIPTSSRLTQLFLIRAAI